MKAIEYMNGKIISDFKLQVTCARFHKRLPPRWSKKSTFSQKKPAWKWIPKVKKVLNQDTSSPYKQALLSCSNDNELGAQEGANEAVMEDIITQPLDNAYSRPIYIGKLISQVPSYGSSIKDDEKINSTSRAFDGPLEMEFQFYDKSKRRKLSNEGK
ncbi:hypothetical protein Cgig2_009389 [Carnegiea gigantea]|uniref:Uncharacterized protein n=1 Tax=Carnegiea gigantea TaxID=171969 RepID=A0A9Q1JQK1_9CARY|nr:hypothetical protein Cgig2_009389 [Carnegiea gigantea]